MGPRRSRPSGVPAIVSGPRRLSASARVLFAMTGMLATAIAVLVLVAYSATSRTLTSSVDQTLQREAEAYSAAMKGAPAGEALADATRAYMEGRTGGESGGLSPILLVRFNDGRVISNSEVRVEEGTGAVPTSTTEPVFVDVTLDGDQYRVLATPIIAQGQSVGVFEAALAMGPIQQTASGVATTLSAAGLIALAIVLPLAYYGTRRALAPLTRMAEDAAAISHARPGRRIEYDGPPDELGSLADSLNSMLKRLENAFDDQRRFVADASHELRTPVAVVRGNVELLRSGSARGDEAGESLEMIEHEAVRMTRLLDQMLSLARLEDADRLRVQPLSVSTMIDEVTARARALGDRNIVHGGECGLWIEGDPDLLDQALVNLVRNAFAHTRAGGRIAIECESDERNVRILVTDDGRGIPPQEVDRVFDRFFRAQSARRDTDTGGAGLGLAIVRRLVELHGGRVWAENAQPHGARFVIELPRIPEPADQYRG